MIIRDLDHDEGMLLLRYRLLPPDKQKELQNLLEDLHKETKSSQNSTDEHQSLKLEHKNNSNKY